MLESKWVRYPAIAGVLIVAGVLLSAFIASGPFSENEFEKPIKPKTRWIEVRGDDFEITGNYAAEGQTETVSVDFYDEPGEDCYVSWFTIYLIWQDDARTEPDTFSFRVLDDEGEQVIAGGGSSGQAQAPVRLNNTELNHVVNNVDWSVEVTCNEARDGYIGPAGIFTIPDDGNDFTVRFEWKHFIEHNPEWE